MLNDTNHKVQRIRIRVKLIGSAMLILFGFVLFWRSAHRPSGGVTVSFLGYTNLSKSPVISALVSINNNDSVPIRFDLSSEDENKQEVRVVLAPRTTASALACGSSSVYAVEAPVGSAKWRVRLRYFRCTAKERVYYVAWKHQLPEKLGSLWPNFACPFPQVTNSIWLTQ